MPEVPAPTPPGLAVSRYISLWQLGALSGGLQGVLSLSSPYRLGLSHVDSSTTLAVVLCEQAHYWAPMLLAAESVHLALHAVYEGEMGMYALRACIDEMPSYEG